MLTCQHPRVSVTTMLSPLNIIKHIRKDTLRKELMLRKYLPKLIDDPSLTSQNNTEEVDSKSIVEALPTLEEHHSSPVQSLYTSIYCIFSPLAPGWASIPQGETWRHQNKRRRPHNSTADPNHRVLKRLPTFFQVFNPQLENPLNRQLV